MNIWTDGSCYPNPGPGGWAWLNEETGESDCGGEHDTTNNRMEMLLTVCNDCIGNVSIVREKI